MQTQIMPAFYDCRLWRTTFIRMQADELNDANFIRELRI